MYTMMLCWLTESKVTFDGGPGAENKQTSEEENRYNINLHIINWSSMEN